MKEVKPSKKPLAIYYAIVLAVLLLLNLVLLPWMSERQVEEVDYGTFMTMTEEKNIGRVDIESNQIIFTDKEEKQVYKTGLMNDPELTQRLYDAGAQFSSEIVEQGSPMLNFLIWFLLPILLFSFIGNQMNKKLMEKAGGGPGSMMFGGVGKSNAKVYVQSTHGIRFADVAGEDEAKENLQEIVDYLHDPGKYESIGASMPKGILLVGPPGTGKTMLAKAVAGEANVPFFSISGSDFVEMFDGVVCIYGTSVVACRRRCCSWLIGTEAERGQRPHQVFLRPLRSYQDKWRQNKKSSRTRSGEMGAIQGVQQARCRG